MSTKMPPAKLRFPFGLCKICNDKATGIHYGVATCEGCKGFFKRSIVKSEKYRCFFGKDCNLNPQNRNRCKYCRFQLCLKSGMSVEAVRMGRIPKLEKEKALLACQIMSEGDCMSMDNLTDNLPEKFIYNKARRDLTDCDQPESNRNVYKFDARRSMAAETVTCPSPDKLAVHSTVMSLPHDHTSSCTQGLDTRTHSGEYDGQKMEPGVRVLTEPGDSDVAAVKLDGESMRQDTTCTENYRINRRDYSGSEHIDRPPLISLRNTSPPHTERPKPEILERKYDHKFHRKSTEFPTECCHPGHIPRGFFDMDRRIMPQIVAIPDHTLPFSYSESQLQEYDKHKDAILTRNYKIPTFSSYAASDNLQSAHIGAILETTIQTSIMPLVLPHTVTCDVDQYNVPGTLTDTSTEICMPVPAKCCTSSDQHPANYSASIKVGNNFAHPNDSSFHQPADSELSKNRLFRHTDSEMPGELSVNYCLITKPMNEMKQSGYTDSRSIDNKSEGQTGMDTENEMKEIGYTDTTSIDNKSEGQTGMDTENEMKEIGYTDTRGIDNKLEGQTGMDTENEMKEIGYTDTTSIDNKSEGQTGMDTENEMQQKGNFNNSADGETNIYEDLNRVTKELMLSNHLDNICSKMKPLGNVGVEFNLEKKPLLASQSMLQDQLTPSFPSACATSSLSNHTMSTGSTSSLQACYSPRVIKILLEQVLDMTQNRDIAEKVKLRLTQNQTDQSVVAEILCLIGEVVKKHRCSLSQSDTESSGIFASEIIQVTENKMERMQKFLNDVEIYSINQALALKQLSGDLQASADSGKGLSHHENSFSLTGTQTAKLPPEEDNLAQSSSLNLHGNQVANKDELLESYIDRLKLAMIILCRLSPEHREKLRLWKAGQIHMRVMTDSDEDVKLTFKKVVDGIPILSERITGFCQSVPGFSELDMNDRGILMKRAYYDIWMLRAAESFSNGEVNIILETGEIYSRPAMTKILNEEMVELLLSFAQEFNALELNDLEVSIICAVQLTQTDKLELIDKSAADKLHSLMVDVLTLVICRNHPDNSTQLLIDICQILPALDIINEMQMQIIAAFNLNKYGDD